MEPPYMLKQNIIGRLGNQMFQFASSYGIAEANKMNLCLTGDYNGLVSTFMGPFPDECQPDLKFSRDVEDGSARFKEFHLQENTQIGNYLQSWKYFNASHVRPFFQFVSHIDQDARKYVQRFGADADDGVQLIGIHVRRGDHVHKLHYMRFPPSSYFVSVLTYFRTKFGPSSRVQFVVASDEPEWCLQQPFLQNADVHVITDSHDASLDMAILAMCDHVVMTIGTFGWWAAWLGAYGRGGEVIYYAHEFIMHHVINKNHVDKTAYYPPEWKGIGELEPIEPIEPIGLIQGISEIGFGFGVIISVSVAFVFFLSVSRKLYKRFFFKPLPGL
eukprot:GEMP01031151.1.p1 GENE.GEMP01031151.1~~GEMP01031151.1.p1  ORF type:complete len:330 (+),score=28.98 GEMP01031151.1:105-1094(+)